MSDAPACHRGAGWTSSRIGRRSPWAAPCSPGVAVLLSLLWTSLHLQLANLLGLEVAVLLLDWEGEDVGELFAVPVDIGLAYLDLDLSRNVITI